MKKLKIHRKKKNKIKLKETNINYTYKNGPIFKLQKVRRRIIGSDINNSNNTYNNLDILSKNKEHLKQLNKILINNNHPFTSFKFKNISYKKGDVLFINSNDSILIGELVRIISKNGISKYPFWPSIEIKWYYKKNEINRIKNGIIKQKDYDSIGENEVFPSEHKDIVFIESVLGKVQVFDIKDYEQIEEVYENIYYTRARYNYKTEMLEPRFEDWERICICNMPLNPDEKCIQCEKCKKWFHIKCLGLMEEEVEAIKEYFCNDCKEDNK